MYWQPHQHHGGVGGEAPQQRLGHKLNDQHYGNAVTGGDHGGVFQGLGGALRLACAKVLGRQRRYRRQHGGRHNEHGADDFFHNAHGGRINQAAVVGNDGDNDERDLNAAVLHSDRQADFKNTAQHAFARAEVLAAQPQAVLCRRMPNKATITLKVCERVVPSAAPTGQGPWDR